MARSPDCMLRLESLAWHSGTPVTTISVGIQRGELAATGKPKRVKAADFEAWLERQAMDGGKRYKRRDELAKWRARYPEGDPAPYESYPLAEQAPEPGPQHELVPDAPAAAPAVDLTHRGMLLRVLAAVEEGATFDELDGDVLEYWDHGACHEGRVLFLRGKLEMAEHELRLAKSAAPCHGALTDDELAALEAA